MSRSFVTARKFRTSPQAIPHQYAEIQVLPLRLHVRTTGSSSRSGPHPPRPPVGVRPLRRECHPFPSPRSTLLGQFRSAASPVTSPSASTTATPVSSSSQPHASPDTAPKPTVTDSAICDRGWTDQLLPCGRSPRSGIRRAVPHRRCPRPRRHGPAGRRWWSPSHPPPPDRHGWSGPVRFRRKVGRSAGRVTRCGPSLERNDRSPQNMRTRVQHPAVCSGPSLRR